MKIFISHSSKNENYGNLLVELLRGLGVKESEIIFTSNVAYGIPVAQNIFNWLKSQIEEKPFVIYLLSKEYYESVACLNEMGAAWIVENEHAAIFTPSFSLSSKEFQNGALDPREIGFKINDEDRVLSFIQMLSKNFEITNSAVLISQSVKKFIKELEQIKPNATITKKPIIPQNKTETITVEPLILQTEKKEKPISKDGGSLYSKFIRTIINRKVKEDELLLLHYIIETGSAKLMMGWQADKEISKIVEWEKINDIKDILSRNYESVIQRFELRGFTIVSALTSSDNAKEVKLQQEIAIEILDLPSDVIEIINEVVKKNYFEHIDEPKIEDSWDF
jgi:hypothetical protein